MKMALVVVGVAVAATIGIVFALRRRPSLCEDVATATGVPVTACDALLPVLDDLGGAVAGAVGGTGRAIIRGIDKVPIVGSIIPGGGPGLQCPPGTTDIGGPAALRRCPIDGPATIWLQGHAPAWDPACRCVPDGEVTVA